jgi:hypothetical protein
MDEARGRDGRMDGQLLDDLLQVAGSRPGDANIGH